MKHSAVTAVIWQLAKLPCLEPVLTREVSSQLQQQQVYGV